MKKSMFLLLAILLASISFSFAQSGNVKYNYIPKDPVIDNLLTAENTVLAVIDYQQEMLGVVYSIDQKLLMKNRGNNFLPCFHNFLPFVLFKTYRSLCNTLIIP